MQECPQFETLQALLERSLDAALLLEVESHINSCENCRQVLQQLSAANEETQTQPAGDQETSEANPRLTIADRIAQYEANHVRSESFAQANLPEVDGYEIESLIARGGMGIVYRALQKEANRTVALKMMLQGAYASAEEVTRFQIEARAAARLTHQYIVPIHDVGTCRGQHYFSMGYIAGSSCKDLIQEGPLSNRECAELLLHLTDAIAYAHSQGIVHRDLKPGNILIDSQGKPHITDFGLAKRIDASDELTATGQVLGTPGFMAPEQALGKVAEVGPLSDVYSLGAVLYTCLTGRPPFQCQTPVETMLQVIEQPPVPPRMLNASADVDLETICLKCLEKSPQQRYQSADDLRRELTDYLEGRPIQARPLSAFGRLRRWCKRRPITAALVAGVVGSLLIGTLVSTYFALLANERARGATAGTRIALTSLETIINTVNSKLRDVPGARKIRRELLNDAIDDLERILGDSTFQHQIDHDMANVYVDIGILYQEIGGDEGGKADQQAERSLRRAIEMFEVLNDDADQADDQLLADHARALNQLGDFLNKQGRLDEAEPLIQRGLSIRRQLARRTPPAARMRLHLSASILSLADCYSYRGQNEQALQTIPEAIALAQELVSEDPTVSDYLRQLFRCHLAAGDYSYDAGKNDDSRRYYELALADIEEFAQRFPAITTADDDLSMCYERLGHHWSKVGDNRRALEYYEKMLASLQQVVAIDPDDRSLKEGLATAYDNLYRSYTEAGETTKANDALQKRNELDQWLARPAQ